MKEKGYFIKETNACDSLHTRTEYVHVCTHLCSTFH